MATKPSALPDHLGYWLRKLSNAVSSSFADRLARFDVSVAQWAVLRTLYEHESLPLKEIVARVEVDQGSLSRMVDRLLARGLVLREEDISDRRAVAVSLSKAGRLLVPKLAAEADKNDAHFFYSLSRSQKEELLQTIHALLAQQQSDSRSPVD